MFCVVADDEPRLRQVLVRLMTADGFTCVEAANGEEALEQLGKVPAQLLLTDLRMPKMDGIELLHAGQGALSGPRRDPDHGSRRRRSRR